MTCLTDTHVGPRPAELDIAALDHLLDILDADGALHPGAVDLLVGDAADCVPPALLAALTDERSPAVVRERAAARVVGHLLDVAHRRVPSPRLGRPADLAPLTAHWSH